VKALTKLALAFALAATARAGSTSVDLLVEHGTLVTVDPGRRVIPDGALAITGGKIVAVGPRVEVLRDYKGRAVLDAEGGLVIPGLVNAHTHAPMVLFRGLADDLPLMDWLRNKIFPAEARHVNPEFVRAGTRLAALEMIRSGTTTFVDMYYFEDAVAEVVDEAGLRGVLGETIIDFPSPDQRSPKEAIEAGRAFLKRYAGHPRIVPALAPHSTYLCAPEVIREADAATRPFGAPLLMHLSETRDEQEQIRTRYGKTPTELLAELGVLRRGFVGAHGCYLTPGDRALLKAAGAGVAHCPESNMKLASGAAPVAAMLNEGIALGLGTDGAASNNDLDMFEEMLAAALLAKHTTGDPTAAPAPAVLEMATLGGARALGLEREIGSLEAGKRADVVVVGLGAPRLHPLYDPVSHLVYAAKGSDVRDVVVEGRILMREGRLKTLDERAVLRSADLLAQAIAGARP
jgi:5-methylthioadenosine/S-adenosylhomocysteine deaminase